MSPANINTSYLVRHQDGVYVADRRGVVTNRVSEAFHFPSQEAAETWAARWNKEVPQLPVTVIPATLSPGWSFDGEMGCEVGWTTRGINGLLLKAHLQAALYRDLYTAAHSYVNDIYVKE